MLEKNFQITLWEMQGHRQSLAALVGNQWKPVAPQSDQSQEIHTPETYTLLTEERTETSLSDKAQCNT